MALLDLGVAFLLGDLGGDHGVAFLEPGKDLDVDAVGDAGGYFPALRLVAGAEHAHYGPQDFRILASVGSLDPALGDMAPQLAQLRADYPDLMTDDSLQLWIDEGENHSMTSVGNQVAHNLPLLFPPA